MGDALMNIMYWYADFYNEHIAGITSRVISLTNTVKECFSKLVDKAKPAAADDSNETEPRQANSNSENADGVIQVSYA